MEQQAFEATTCIHCDGVPLHIGSSDVAARQAQGGEAPRLDVGGCQASEDAIQCHVSVTSILGQQEAAQR